MIDGKSEKTKHPLIFKAKEKFQNTEIILDEVEKLKDYLKKGKKQEVFEILKSLVPEWNV